MKPIRQLTAEGRRAVSKTTVNARESQIPEPNITRFLFADTRMAPVWLVVRVYLGYLWLTAGIGKVIEGGWMRLQKGRSRLRPFSLIVSEREASEGPSLCRDPLTRGPCNSRWQIPERHIKASNILTSRTLSGSR